jgi:hypothetical protein
MALGGWACTPTGPRAGRWPLTECGRRGPSGSGPGQSSWGPGPAGQLEVRPLPSRSGQVRRPGRTSSLNPPGRARGGGAARRRWGWGKPVPPGGPTESLSASASGVRPRATSVTVTRSLGDRNAGPGRPRSDSMIPPILSLLWHWQYQSLLARPPSDPGVPGMGIGRIIGDAESGSNRGGHYELALYVPLALVVGLQWRVYECGKYIRLNVYPRALTMAQWQ